MPMKLVFTISNSFVSRAITYLTEEPVSHVAIELDSVVVHSSLWGPEIVTKENFYSKRHLIHTIDLPQELDAIRVLAHITKYDNRLYDYTGLLYLGLRYFAKKYLKLDLPKVNLWQISGMYTCTEFASELVWGYEDSLITPHKLYLKLKEGLHGAKS